jgi:hypothetical protein
MGVLTRTTLASAYTQGDLTMKFASVTPATGGTAAVRGNIIQVDSEFYKQTSDAIGLNVPVAGGKEGSAAVSHVKGAPVLFGAAADFPSAPYGHATVNPASPAWVNVSYGVAGAIVLPTTRVNEFVVLLTGTAGAFTLANPSLAIDGVEMIIQAGDAQAYTVTNPAGFLNTTTSSDVATFNGVLGSTLHVKAQNGVWTVISGITAGVSVA